MRSSVVTSFALALALVPAALFAQPPAAGQQPTTAGQQPTTAGQQPPTAGQPPAAQGTQPAAEAPKVGFQTPAGLLLVQVKPDQTAAFEEMINKIRTGLNNSTDPALKQQAASWSHVYKAQEGMAGNALYVVVLDPTTPGTEYQFLEVLNKTLTEEQKRDPATQDMYKRYAAAIATMNRLNLAPVGGAQ